MLPVICIDKLSKTYASGFQALKNIEDAVSGAPEPEQVDLFTDAAE